MGHKTSKAVNLGEGQAGVKEGRGKGAGRRQNTRTHVGNCSATKLIKIPSSKISHLPQTWGQLRSSLKVGHTLLRFL